MKITNHAKQRMKERCGFSKKSQRHDYGCNKSRPVLMEDLEIIKEGEE